VAHFCGFFGGALAIRASANFYYTTGSEILSIGNLHKN
jgi:hypothetical protein